MGTSSRWPGPSGGVGTLAGEWGRGSGRLSRWRPETPGALEALEAIADDQLAVLHRTLRAAPSAFGLREAAYAAGQRLVSTVEVWIRNRETVRRDEEDQGLDPVTQFVADFTNDVGGQGGTFAEAAVRRAAMTSLQRLLTQRPDAASPGDGAGWSGELLCLLYRLFFADVVAEFLRGAIAEKIKLVVPILPEVDPEDRIADRIADHVTHMLPNPCEEAERLHKEAEKLLEGQGSAAEGPEVRADPALGLTVVQAARHLVPKAVDTALGLLTDDQDDAEEVPAT